MRILLGGHDDAMAQRLAGRLTDAAIIHCGADQLPARLGEGGWDLVILDERITRNAAEAVLAEAAHRAGPVPHVLCCLPELTDPRLPRRLVEQLGVMRLMSHPLDEDELAREAARITGGVLRPVARDEPDPIAASLATLWARHREGALAKAVALKDFSRAPAVGGGERGASEAESAAHMLAGTLGMYGLGAASATARLLEREIGRGAAGDRARTARLAHDLLMTIRASSSAADAPIALPSARRLAIVSEDAQLWLPCRLRGSLSY